MPGIIDDEVGHVIYLCKTARTLSHLLLRGIVPPTPFRLIVKSPRLISHRPNVSLAARDF